MKAIFKVLLFMGLILAGKFYKDEAALLPEAKANTLSIKADNVKLVQSGSSDTEEKVEEQIKVKAVYSY